MSTLNENILKVKETFDNIAIAIEEQGVDVGECDSPTTYADKIRSIVGTGGGLDPEKLYTEAFETEDNVSVTPSLTEDGGVMLTFGLKRGPAGPAGQDGRDGVDGQDGQDGAQGPVGPAGPAGPKGDNGATPMFKIEDGYWYVSYDNTTWTLMGKATGEDGKDGEDGEDGTGSDVNEFRIEFIYKRVADKNVEVLKPENDQEDRYQPEGWTLAPQGVTSEFQIEYVSQREKDNDEWQDWSEPAVWAIYGSEGRDGNGIEYIFKLTESESAIPEIPMAPAEGEEQYPADWSDEPLSVTEETPCCWVSTRHQYYNAEGIQMWSEYSIPSLWAKYGKDGEVGPQGPAGEKGDKGDPGTLSDEDKQAIVTEAVENLNKSFYTIAEIDALKKNLQEAIESGDAKATADAASALNAANSFNAELASLKSKFNTNEDGTLGTLNSSALNESDIYDLSVAALGNDIEDSEGELHEDALFAKQIVSVISTFGSVKADNITGEVISGKTIKSAEGNWELREDGSATLGSGGIEIASDGTITFGPNVSLNWEEDSNTVSIYVRGNTYLDENTEYLWTGKQEIWDEEASRYVWASRADYDDFMAEEYTNDDGDNRVYNLVFTTKGQDIKVGDTAIVGGTVWYDYDDTDSWFPEECDYDPVVIKIKNESEQDLTETVNELITQKVDKTYIDGLGITAPNITAEALQAHESYIGSLVADNVTAKSLNTTPTEKTNSGRILIENNDIKVYSKGSDPTPSLIMSGDNEELYVPLQKSLSASTYINQVLYYPTYNTYNKSFEGCISTSNLGSFTLPDDGFEYNLTGQYLTSTPVNIYVEETEGNSSNIVWNPCEVYSMYIISESNSLTSSNFSELHSRIDEEVSLTYVPLRDLTFEGGQFYAYNEFGSTGAPVLDLGDTNNVILHENDSFKEYPFITLKRNVKYYVYHYIYVKGSIWTQRLDQFSSQWVQFDNSEMISPKLTVTPIGNVSKITKSGMISMKDYTKYLIFDSGKIQMRMGDYALGIDIYGPYIVSGGKTYRFNPSNMTEETTDYKKHPLE